MPRFLLFIAFALSACSHTKAPPPPVAMRAPAPPSLYRSGSRLKIRWAQAVGAASPVRMLHSIFDTKLGRECTLGYGEAEQACIPEPDKTLRRDEYVAYLDAEQLHPARVVADGECGELASPPRDTSTLWALPIEGSLIVKNPTSRLEWEPRYVLDAPLRAPAWTADGPPGCVVRYVRRPGLSCVRAFRAIDNRDDVRVTETEIGGILLGAATDGARLPLDGPKYVDSRHGFRCNISAEESACLPYRRDGLWDEPVVGANVKTMVMQRGGSRWAQSRKSGVWAELALPGPSEPSLGVGQFATRKVLSLLGDHDVLHFPSHFEGGGRLVLRLRKTPDGRSVPVSFYDTLLESDCGPAKTADGRWRCVVELPETCEATHVLENGRSKDVLSPRPSSCTTPETCCRGGTYWLEGAPASGPHRFGINPGAYFPAIPERTVRFSKISRISNHVESHENEPHIVHDALEETSADAFVPLQIVEDP